MPADNPAGLISLAALQSAAKSYLFYSKPNGELAYLKSQVEREEASGTAATVPLYEPENIILDGKVVIANTKSPQIAAVSYIYNNLNEIRVYYISDHGKLQELCRTEGGPWRVGSLSTAGYRASPKSLLTASVDYTGKGELKIYYNEDDDDAMMHCAWVTVGGNAWSPRIINDHY